MNKDHVRYLGRKVAVVAIGMSLIVGVAGVAGASSNRHGPANHHDSSQGHRGIGHHDIKGVVSAVSSTSITVQRSAITTTTLAIAATTRFFEGHTPVTQAALVAGERVDISRTASAPGTAAKITIEVAALAGTVSAVSGSVITITGGEGFTRTIDVSSTTTFSEGGTAVALSAVVVGSKIKAQGLVSSDQTALDAISVVIAAPKDVRGNVSAVTSTSVTVLGSDNTSTTLTIAPTTTFFEGSTPVTAAALVVGVRVDITRLNTSLTTAVKINIEVATLTGIVTSVSGNVITITGGEGFTRTIDVSSATTYSEGGAAATLSSVAIGLKIKATGIVSANETALNALTVLITAPKVVKGNVSAVSSTSVTVQGPGNTTTVVTIAPTTTFFAGSSPVTQAALAVGEHVDVALLPSSPTTAAKIIIEVATLTGIVSSVSGNVITITGGEGFTRTIDVSSATTYSEGGTAVTLSSVIVDARIVAHGIVASDQTTLDALTVSITAPKDVIGVVSAVSSTSVTVQGPGNTSTVLTIAPTTSFFAGSTAVTQAALVVGEHVDITRLSTSLTTAAKVTIQLATLAGTVTSVSANTIVISSGHGFARTIVVSSTTTYSKGGSASTLSAVTVGSKISAQGLVASDQTTLDALNVTIAAH
jgi:hypothetical protein